MSELVYDSILLTRHLSIFFIFEILREVGYCLNELHFVVVFDYNLLKWFARITK